MWIPPELTQTVCFMCVQDGNKWLYGGTGFFVAKFEPDYPNLQWAYLVTAKHCVVRAFEKYSNLYFRVNTKNGNLKFVDVPHYSSSRWLLSEKADVAVLQIEDDQSAELLVLPPNMFVTDLLVRDKQIGLGDEVFVIGLFREVYGKKRNFPIIRSGMIASMLSEPLQDQHTGDDYSAFLVEVRSISGLSGSPVFMALKKRGAEMYPVPRGFHPMTHQMLLLGLIRGHWDVEESDTVTDFGTSEGERLNTGIAIVTPIQEVEKILMGDELRKSRRADIRKHHKSRSSAEDPGVSP